MTRAFVHHRTPVGIRTPNLLIRNQVLYPVELQARAASPKVRRQTPVAQDKTPTVSSARSVADNRSHSNNIARFTLISV